MSIKLYVGNLAYQVTETEIQELFSPFGTIESVKIITDRSSGESKGFGFVEMANRQEGEAAINELNGQELQSRAIVVSEARARPTRGGGGGFGGGGGGGSRRSHSGEGGGRFGGRGRRG